MDKLAGCRRQDAAVERHALALGLCTAEAVARCRALQARVAALDVAVSLLHLLQDQGIVRPEDGARLARLAARELESANETLAAVLDGPATGDPRAAAADTAVPALERRAGADETLPAVLDGPATGDPRAAAADTAVPALDRRAGADETLPASGDAPPVVPGVPVPGRSPNADTILDPDRGATLAPGSGTPGRIGEYRLVREVGRGGMGVVYEAIQEPFQRRVAVKVLLAIGEDPARVERFRREANAAARLAHPGIVRVFGAGEANGTWFYAMEFVDGKSFAALAFERRFAPHEAARWIADAADALHYAHEQGLVHRDIKPANLMLDRSGRTLITDFGLVRDDQQGSLTGSGQIMGTPRYMSPEQADGRNDEVGARSDVYSLGACLYELLAAKPIFEGDSVALLLRKVLFEDPAPLRRHVPALPVDLETVCLKAVAKEPERRYATALELRHDLERFLAGEAILARPMGPVSRLLRKVRRHPVAAGAWATALVVAGIALSLAWAARAAEQARSGVLNGASTRFAQGRVDEALSQIGELLRTAPDYAPAHLARARMLHRLGRREEALDDYRRALELEPGRWEAALERGFVRASRGDLATALVDARAAQGLAPAAPAPRIAAAHWLAETGDPAQAEANLTGLPDDLPAELERARAAASAAILLARGRIEEAREHARSARRQFGDDARLLEILGRAELAAGDAGAAVSAFSAACTLEPHDARPRVGLAEARIECLDRHEALAELDLALREAPDWHRPHVVRAWLLPPAEGLACARAAVERAPRDADARLLLARLLARDAVWPEAESVARAEPRGAGQACVLAQALLAQGRSADARAVLDEVLADSPDHPEALARRGAARLAGGDRDGARADFTAAIERRERGPDAAVRAVRRAEALFLRHNRTPEVVDRGPRLDALEAAAQHLLLAARANPADGATLSRLGDCMFDRCRWREAATCYREALAVNPLVVDATLGLVFLLLEVADLRQDEEARAATVAALAWHPGIARLHDLLGVQYAREREDEAALAEFTRATELDPDLAPAWKHRAAILRRLGRFADETAALERWRSAAPDVLRHARLLNDAYHARRSTQPALAHAIATRAIDEHPRSGAAYVERADACLDVRRYEQGMLDYMRALELDARLGVKIHCNSLRLMEKFPMGIQILMQQVTALTDKLDDEPAFHFLRAYVEAMGKGSADEARKRLARVLEMNPDFTLAYTLLGALELDAGRHEEALARLNEALRREPEAGLTHYYLACYHAQRGETPRALEHVESALRLGFQDHRDVLAKEKRLAPLQGDPRFTEWTRQR